MFICIDPAAPDPGTSSSLEPSNLGRIILDYQELLIGVNKVSLSWLYFPENGSQCAESSIYNFRICTRTGSGDLQHLYSIDLTDDSITISSSLLYSQDDDTLIYIKVSVLARRDSREACATTEYLHTLSGLGKLHVHIHRLLGAFHL